MVTSLSGEGEGEGEGTVPDAGASAISLSIVIPTLNEELFLPALLKSLDLQVDAPAFEVLVVDSSRDSLTREAAQRAWTGRFPLTYIACATQDVGTQRNRGWRAARAQGILFLDADVRLHPRTLSKLREVAAGQDDVVVTIRHVSDNPTVATTVALVLIRTAIIMARLLGKPVTNGDFIYTTRETLRGVGGFQEGFALAEDTDFGIRAARNGARSLVIQRPSMVASARRLTQTSAMRLTRTWIAAYWRALRTGPTPKDAVDYPFGMWRDDAAGSRTARSRAGRP